MITLSLTKDQYFPAVKRDYPPLYSGLIQTGWSEYARYEEFDLGQKWAMRHTVKSDQIWYFSKEEVEKGGQIVFDSWSDLQRMRRARSIFDKRGAALLSAATKDFAIFAEAYRNYMPVIALVFVPEKLVTERMRQLVGEALPVAEAETLLGLLNVPLEDNIYKLAEYDLAMTDDLSAHAKTFAWLNSRYGADMPYTEQDAAARKAEIDSRSYLTTRQTEKEKVRAAVGRAQEILGRQAWLVDMMQLIVFYRTHRTDTINKAAYLHMPVLKHIASQKGISYDQLLYCLPDEILGSLPAKETLDERRRDHAIVIEEGGVSCLIGKEADEIREFFKEDVILVSELSGSVACKGRVSGTVRVVTSATDSNRVGMGDILVTSMTTPNMVPAMKKAAAFVTDEGGITCHAAIISREMNKPCIIGTKIATKVFKDGDRVEVNADIGIVTKL